MRWFYYILNLEKNYYTGRVFRQNRRETWNEVLLRIIQLKLRNAVASPPTGQAFTGVG